MKFTKMVAIIAILAMATQAKAYDDGTLRRSSELAQNDTTVEQTQATDSKEITKEVNININTQGNTAQPSAQPVTQVEAAPAAESKAEVLRRERQKAEVQTEQKIVEKLEDSRLQEEHARAERLFGTKLDPQPQPQQPQQPQQQPQAAVLPAPVPPAAVTPPPPAPENKPSQVTIEKVEIVQPVQQVEDRRIEPAPEIRAEAPKDEEAPEHSQRYYVGALAGNLNYSASNVKSNYGIGVEVGTILDQRWGISLSYLYSDSDVSDVWNPGLFHSLAQSDVTGAVKYYLLTGRLKPYAGGSLSWINRRYTDLYQNYYGGYGYGGGGYAPSSSSSTNAVDAGLLGGVDFAVTDSFLLGAGAAYNVNVATTNDINFASYNLPPGTQSLEKMSYWTLLLTAKFMF